MGVLAEILAHKRRELAELRKRSPPTSESWPRPLALARGPGQPLRLITEIKRRSPSAGGLSTALGVAERARVYERAGASMLSDLPARQGLTRLRDVSLTRAYAPHSPYRKQSTVWSLTMPTACMNA